MIRELKDIKGNDEIRLLYIFECQSIINLINKNTGTKSQTKDVRKVLGHYRLEIEKNLNHIGR